MQNSAAAKFSYIAKQLTNVSRDVAKSIVFLNQKNNIAIFTNFINSIKALLLCMIFFVHFKKTKFQNILKKHLNV